MDNCYIYRYLLGVNLDPHVKLWRAVIMQALIDARSNAVENGRSKREAIDWLLSKNKDFKWVCLMAELNYERISKAARIILLEDMVISSNCKKNFDNALKKILSSKNSRSKCVTRTSTDINYKTKPERARVYKAKINCLSKMQQK